MATAAVIARILTQYSDVGSKAAQKDLARLEKKISAFGNKALKSFGLATAATAAFAVKLGVDAVKGAAADEKQQAALATALRNTTGATDSAILANQKYLDSLELQVAIDNEKLIPALQTLVTATGDLSQAQSLLSLATDVSAASGKDLSVVSMALSKAVNGNFGALTKLGLPLDANAVKSKDLGKLLVDLARISAGQASAAANTFSGRLETLRLKFNQVADKLGIALMPALVLLVDYIDKRVVPMLDIWITKNEDELNQALQNSVGQIKEVVKAFQDIYKGLEAINAILPFGIGGWIKLVAVLSGISSLITVGGVILRITKQTKLLTAAARGNATTVKALKEEFGFFRSIGIRAIQMSKDFAKYLLNLKGKIGVVARAVATFSRFLLMTPWGRAIGLAVALGTAMFKLAQHFNWFGLGNNKKKLSGAVEEADASMTNAVRNFESMDKALNAYRKSQDGKITKTKEQIAQEKALAAINAKNAAANKKQAAIDAKTAALKAAIQKKYSVKITDADEYENIQLTAVEKLLAKQKDADKSLTDRIKLRKEELALFQALSQNAQRYTDLLAALADEKLSDNEISLLAKKWGLTVDAAKSYIFTIFAIKDEQISEDEVDKLATAWGITKAQASQYLDFFAALNDGKLSDTEIANLMKKWGLTKEEATKYADFISKIGDGKLDDKEIENLKSKWGMTTDQVVDYIKKIGGKVDASGTILSAGDIAALGWTNALNALNAYLAALKSSSGGVPKVGGTTTGNTGTTTQTGPTGTGGSLTAISTATTTKAINEAVAAATKAGESASEIANSMVTGLLGQGVSTQNALSSARYTGQAIAAQQREEQQAAAAAAREKLLSDFKAAEALSAMNDAAATRDYDERFRFMGSSTLDTAKGLMGSGTNSGASTVVNLVVNGSVSTEQDLVSAVRNGLLATQTNGNTLTLQAI